MTLTVSKATYMLCDLIVNLKVVLGEPQEGCKVDVLGWREEKNFIIRIQSHGWTCD